MSVVAQSPASRASLERRLIEQILDRTYAPGQKLPSERELAVESRLSRPVIREVLSGLQERGLVEVFPGRGAYVRERGAMDLASSMGSLALQRGATPRDLGEARAMLEEQSAFLAASRFDAEDAQHLADAMEAFDAATNIIDRAKCDLAFHALIARTAKNPVLEMMFGSIAPLVFELQLRSLDDPVIVEQSVPLHRVVYDAICNGDAKRASAAMRRHVTLSNELYGGDLDVSLDTLARNRLVGLLGDGISLEEVISEVLASYRIDGKPHG
jgi:GntR family transcriptional repressor for pyruvate dehydrogenase complex